MPALLDAESLVKFYGMRPVLRGASLRLTGGDFAALLGPNGSGKSTLLRVLSTLSRPDQGALTVCGVDALAHGDRARAYIGAVMHQPLIYGDLTARENLDFHARLHGVPNASARVAAALDRVQLGARGRDPARTFSRGMTQRLTIARLLMQDARVILLDEPFTGLDIASAAALSALLTELACEGRAVLMATHESRGMEGVTRVLRLADGRLAEDGRP